MMEFSSSVMHKTSACLVGSLALVCFVIWALGDVAKRQSLYLPTRVQVYGDSLFLTLPKYRSDSPKQSFSLGQATQSGLTAFPNKAAHKSGLIANAVDLQLDSRGTLWVLDSGVVDTLRTPRKTGNASILALDADSGKINQIINLGDLVPGRAQYLSIEETKSGTRFLYVSDGPSRSIAVWDVKANKGHRVLLPERTMPKIRPKVLYTSLVGSRLYFTYFGGSELFYIETSGLRKGGIVKIVGRKDPRMVFLGSAGYEIIFRLAGEKEVLSWDTRNPLDGEHISVLDLGDAKKNAMAAVPNYGYVWVLETDVKSFLKGKQPEHSFRALNATKGN
ncbi:uncharacterized protein LOC106668998 [Cimex lectularius]|uniref:Uncharacterized protein n=1 Tax=Cimex lectularius TaxID=79782 RepID=A0A8I6S5I5_CIMLE|nr:uncharacterized protein LOC106668998 [Cimex lectularius]